MPRGGRGGWRRDEPTSTEPKRNWTVEDGLYLNLEDRFKDLSDDTRKAFIELFTRVYIVEKHKHRKLERRLLDKIGKLEVANAALKNRFGPVERLVYIGIGASFLSLIINAVVGALTR